MMKFLIGCFWTAMLLILVFAIMIAVAWLGTVISNITGIRIDTLKAIGAFSVLCSVGGFMWWLTDR